MAFNQAVAVISCLAFVCSALTQIESNLAEELAIKRPLLLVATRSFLTMQEFAYQHLDGENRFRTAQTIASSGRPKLQIGRLESFLPYYLSI